MGGFSKESNRNITEKNTFRPLPDASMEERAQLFSKDLCSDASNTQLFRERLEKKIVPTMTAKDMAFSIVKTALEIEFGPSFTTFKGSDKMIRKIADSVMVNPQLRRQALTISTFVLDKKIHIGSNN